MKKTNLDKIYQDQKINLQTKIQFETSMMEIKMIRMLQRKKQRRKRLRKKVVRYGKGGKEIIKEEKKKENKMNMLKKLNMEEKKK